MNIVGTGLSGLVGSRVVELLKNRFVFEDLSLDTNTDIRERDKVWQRITNSDAQVVLHLAAKANVDACEEDKTLGKEGEAWKVNVNGTQNVVDACNATGKKIIYISTDFVFDGEKESENGYVEDDAPHPINWYSVTKYEGEKIVQQAKTPWIIARLAYPYRHSFVRNDFVRALLAKLQAGEAIAAIEDHIMTPTFIDDFAHALAALLDKEQTGIFHVVGSEFITPYNAAVSIAKEFNLDQTLIQKTTRNEYFKRRAQRPFRLAISNDKIKQLGVNMKGFIEGIAEVKAQMKIS